MSAASHLRGTIIAIGNVSTLTIVMMVLMIVD
jgi:hypothetical protein